MKLDASMLDWSKQGLDPAVFDDQGKLKPEHKAHILSKLYKKLDEAGLQHYDEWIDTIHIIGSLTSYRYAKTTDIDVHPVVDLDKFLEVEDQELDPQGAADLLNELGKELSREETEVLEGTKHEIEYYFETYFQEDGEQTWITLAETTEGDYDVLTDEWTKDPLFVDYDWDADTIYKTVLEEAKELADEFDVDIGEIKREIKDIELLDQSLQSFKSQSKQSKFFLEKIEEKIDIIETDILDMAEKGEAAHEEREEQFEGDAEDLAKGVKFKYLQRYGYIWLYKQLQKLFEEEAKPELTLDEIPQVKKIIKEFKMSENLFQILSVLKKQASYFKDEASYIESNVLKDLGMTPPSAGVVPVFVQGSTEGKEFISVVATDGELKGQRFKVPVADLHKLSFDLDEYSNEYQEVIREYFLKHPEAKMDTVETSAGVRQAWLQRMAKQGMLEKEKDFNTFKQFFVESQLSAVEDWFTERCPEVYAQAIELKKQAKIESEQVQDLYEKTIVALNLDEEVASGWVLIVSDIDAGGGASIDLYYEPEQDLVKEVKSLADKSTNERTISLDSFDADSYGDKGGEFLNIILDPVEFAKKQKGEEWYKTKKESSSFNGGSAAEPAKKISSLDPETLNWIKAVLLNDEASTDEELVQHFIKEGPMTKEQAEWWVGKRNEFLASVLPNEPDFEEEFERAFPDKEAAKDLSDYGKVVKTWASDVGSLKVELLDAGYNDMFFVAVDGKIQSEEPTYGKEKSLAYAEDLFDELEQKLSLGKEASLASVVQSMENAIAGGYAKIPYAKRQGNWEYSLDANYILHVKYFATEVITADFNAKKVLKVTTGGYDSVSTKAGITRALDDLRGLGYEVPEMKGYETEASMGKKSSNIGIDYQSKFTSEEEDEIRNAVCERIADVVLTGSHQGEIYEELPDGKTVRGWFKVHIEEDENDEDIRNEEVARLIREGNSSGYYPTFSWSANVWNPDEPKESPKRKKKSAKKESTLLSWDESDIVDAEVEFRMSEPGEFDYILEKIEYEKEDGTESDLWTLYDEVGNDSQKFLAKVKELDLWGEFEEKVRGYVYLDSDIFQFAWQDLIADLDNELKKRSPSGLWYAKGRNMGWRHLEGEKSFKADSAEDWLRALLPDTDVSFDIYELPNNGLKMIVFHHDAPTGETYEIYPKEACTICGEPADKKIKNEWYCQNCAEDEGIWPKEKKSSMGKKADQAKAEELAESYINGNISFVREQIGGDIKLFNEVMDALEQFDPAEVKTFKRLMTAGLNGPAQIQKKASLEREAEFDTQLVKEAMKSFKNIQELQKEVQDKDLHPGDYIKVGGVEYRMAEYSMEGYKRPGGGEGSRYVTFVDTDTYTKEINIDYKEKTVTEDEAGIDWKADLGIEKTSEVVQAPPFKEWWVDNKMKPEYKQQYAEYSKQETDRGEKPRSYDEWASDYYDATLEKSTAASLARESVKYGDLPEYDQLSPEEVEEAYRLMNIEDRIMDSMGLDSKGPIKRSPEKAQVYLEEIKKKMPEKVPAKFYKFFENENYHVMNEALSKLDMFEPHLEGITYYTFKSEASLERKAYVEKVPGHKNSKGELAEWVIKSHETGEIISSHKTEEAAKKHLQDMHAHS